MPEKYPSKSKFLETKSSSLSGAETGQLTNTRWWESYLVRYFSGFVVGGLCILVIFGFLYFKFNYGILTKENVASIWESKGAASSLLLIAGLLGSVYSYLVSSPITVIHYGRGGEKSFFEYQSRYFWFAWIVLLVISVFDINLIYEILNPGFSSRFIVASCVLLHITSHFYFIKWGNNSNFSKNMVIYRVIAFFCVRRNFRLRNVKSLQKNSSCEAIQGANKEFGLISLLAVTLSWVVYLLCLIEFFESKIDSPSLLQIYLFIFSIPILWIGISQYATLYKLLSGIDRTHDFYQKLARARGKKGVRDIRETYTHLREHSNSTFIVVLALCFTCAVLLVVDLHLVKMGPSAKLDIDSVAHIIFRVGALLMIWCIPNLFLWSRANSLEKDFAENPYKYMG